MKKELIRNLSTGKQTAACCFTLIELLVVIAIIAITTNSSISVNALFFD